MTELKLVYRGLRQVSDWALRFYSEIYVDGQENVPLDGPLIITPCHHNELLDIATLSVTIPHGRPVCFWAKSSMFKNPLARAILLSSGSIPVARNPNSAPAAADSEQPAQPQTSVHEALFRGTFKALDREEVIGVFPEGTSYTEPCIVQVKDGAARAALEYVKWAKETKGGQAKKLQIVPVGIVYTDKSQYQSRVCVRWGKPIDVEAFAQEKLSADSALSTELDSRPLIKALSTEIEKRMLDLTINAPDWDTLYAIEAARDILWDDKERLDASHFVWMSQNLISLFTDPNAAPSVTKAKQSLLKYHSLLSYSNISHSSLWGIILDPSVHPTRAGALGIFARQVLTTVLHPRFILFLPTFVLHAPAYATGLLADRLFRTRDWEETRAQFKAIFGGVAASAAYAGVTAFIVRRLVEGSPGVLGCVKAPRFTLPAFRALWTVGRWFFAGDIGILSGKARAALGVFGVFYATSFLLSRWHNYWVGSNYKQSKRLLTSWKLVLGLFSPHSSDLTGERLAPYTVPYIPRPNPYIKRRDGAETESDRARLPHAPSVPPRKLIRPLLDARSEATRSLWSFLVDSKYLRGLVTARMRGEAWMQVGPAN
ncbi:glycerol-3-phosphate-1-acyltransferase [Trametes versicolor FP-101664 SS1]|uniref:glycerol-3-phosphate-1-acyltransferase n=1 Tax=Trametes versicolor (strain FP-101664) TaxID=717944 RepID=UPI0004623CE0|nr:glycerol-3-phosphate-1-acyltransferase [Trametes versicolor FP-101664 SS1]EIW55730.1 glycerol-3-phosphate-1-acyltransferase [Trametes versicolor FP-101664 SS1]